MLPPSAGRQYAFIQVSPNNALNDQSSNMSTTLTGLTPNTPYTINFFTGTRNGYAQQSTLTVYVNNVAVYYSQTAVSDSSGWQSASTSTFTPTTSSVSLIFAVQELSSSNSDGVVLIDAISVTAPAVLNMGVALGGNFESPTSLPNGYQYNVGTSVLQPWTWTAQQGGIGAAGGPWDPPYPGTPNDAPPSAAQYAFLQTSPGTQGNMRVSNMSATVVGLTAGGSYNVSFYFAARSQGGIDNATQSQLTVYMSGQQIWQSVPAILDLNGWAPASGLFTASSSSGLLLFQVVSTTDQDHAVLVDSVRVLPTGVSPLVGSTAISGGSSNVALSFGSPPLNGSYYGPGVSLQPYWYNPPISAQQPWVWTPYQGGIAITGSPFDPPAPVLPPSAGRQYAFIQVSPNNALNDQNSNMSTTLTGLTANSPYTISFYTGTRNGYSQTSSLTVYVNGQVVYYSQPVQDASGWQPAVTSAFTSPSSSATLVFAVSAPAGTNSDGQVLIDAIIIGPPSSQSSSSAAPVAAASSSASSSAALSISSSYSSSAAAAGPTSSSSSSSPVQPAVSSSSPVQPAVSSSSSVQAAVSSSAAPAVSSAPSVGVSSSSAAGAPVVVLGSSSSGASVGGGGGGGSGLSGGAIAGIVIGSVVGAALLCLLLFFCIFSSRRQGKQQQQDTNAASQPRGRFNEVEESRNDASHTQDEGVEMTDA